MTTLKDLRQLVRQQTETTEAELPNITIDNYLTQGFERTVNAEVQWPFYENTWTVTQRADQSSISIPLDVKAPGFMSLVDNANGWRLTHIDPEEAEDRFFGATSTTSAPLNFSVWNNYIQLWPQTKYSADRTYQLRGFRLPTNFPVYVGESADPLQEPDMDSRLHTGLAHYATALAYIQQEDMELENQYMKRWLNDVEMARQVIMDPAHNRPIAMGPSEIYTTSIGPGYRGGSRSGFGLNSGGVNTPGPQGPMGPPGPQGPQGPQGPAGSVNEVVTALAVKVEELSARIEELE